MISLNLLLFKLVAIKNMTRSFVIILKFYLDIKGMGRVFYTVVIFVYFPVIKINLPNLSE